MKAGNLRTALFQNDFRECFEGWKACVYVRIEVALKGITCNYNNVMNEVLF